MMPHSLFILSALFVLTQLCNAQNIALTTKQLATSDKGRIVLYGQGNPLVLSLLVEESVRQLHSTKTKQPLFKREQIINLNDVVDNIENTALRLEVIDHFTQKTIRLNKKAKAMRYTSGLQIEQFDFLLSYQANHFQNQTEFTFALFQTVYSKDGSMAVIRNNSMVRKSNCIVNLSTSGYSILIENAIKALFREETNIPPTASISAYVGQNQVHGDKVVSVGDTVTLDATGTTDLDTPIEQLKYHWSPLNTAASSSFNYTLIQNPDAAKQARLAVVFNEKGTYKFALSVNDGISSSPKEFISITAVPPPTLKLREKNRLYTARWVTTSFKNFESPRFSMKSEILTESRHPISRELFVDLSYESPWNNSDLKYHMRFKYDGNCECFKESKDYLLSNKQDYFNRSSYYLTNPFEIKAKSYGNHFNKRYSISVQDTNAYEGTWTLEYFEKSSDGIISSNKQAFHIRQFNFTRPIFSISPQLYIISANEEHQFSLNALAFGMSIPISKFLFLAFDYKTSQDPEFIIADTVKRIFSTNFAVSLEYTSGYLNSSFQELRFGAQLNPIFMEEIIGNDTVTSTLIPGNVFFSAAPRPFTNQFGAYWPFVEFRFGMWRKSYAIVMGAGIRWGLPL